MIFNHQTTWRTSLFAGTVACLMFAFGYAMIPLYYKICNVLGIDTALDETYASTQQPPAVRSLRVEFDANSHNSLVAMRPVLRVTQMNTGTAYSLNYEITNLTDRRIRGTAIPSYSPARAAAWFTKLQCFCFNEIDLQPSEIYQAPVVFILERELPIDIETVALSYTFHINDADFEPLKHTN